jgi:hypothetical protein
MHVNESLQGRPGVSVPPARNFRSAPSYPNGGGDADKFPARGPREVGSLSEGPKSRLRACIDLKVRTAWVMLLSRRSWSPARLFFATHDVFENATDVHRLEGVVLLIRHLLLVLTRSVGFFYLASRVGFHVRFSQKWTESRRQDAISRTNFCYACKAKCPG